MEREREHVLSFGFLMGEDGGPGNGRTLLQRQQRMHALLCEGEGEESEALSYLPGAWRAAKAAAHAPARTSRRGRVLQGVRGRRGGTRGRRWRP